MNFNSRKFRYSLIALSLLIIITGAVSIASSGKTSARYKSVQSLDTATVTVNANLASDLEVKEHVAERQTSGVYAFGSGFTTSGNPLHIMPGVDILKDPAVYVTGKTEIAAYLYVEVIDSTGLDSAVFHYEIDSKWLEIPALEQTTGSTVRRVYVYAEGGAAKTVTNADNLDGINILKDQKITVSSNFNPDTFTGSGNLQFKAYMAQAAQGNSALTIFSSQFS